MKDVWRRVAAALAAVESDPRLFRDSFYTVQADLVFGPNVYQIVAEGKALLLDGYVQPLSDTQVGLTAESAGNLTANLLDSELQALSGSSLDRGFDLSELAPAGIVLPGQPPNPGAERTATVLEQHARQSKANRGMQRLTLRADHPDIEAFLALQASAAFECSACSIAVPDALLQAVEAKGRFDLVHAVPPPGVPAETVPRDAAGRYLYKTVSAVELWQKILHYLQKAVPIAAGQLLFVDRLLGYAPLSQAYPAMQTLLPAANLTLPAYAGTCSAAINLTRLVQAPFSKAARFDEQRFRYVIGLAVQMLDNVHTLTQHPLVRQQSVTAGLRPIALTFTGLADALAMLRLPYGSDAALAFAERMAQVLTAHAHLASVELAERCGPFPQWKTGVTQGGKSLRDHYVESALIRSLPVHLQTRIHAHGLRNATVVAMPAWHIAHDAFADGVSAGLNPVSEWEEVHTDASNPGVEHTVQDYAQRVYYQLQHAERVPRGRPPSSLQLARDVSVTARVQLHAAVSRHLDGGASLPPLTDLRRIGQMKDFCRGIWQSGVGFG
jgi:ribonucleoside-diphosphate reductase alpha chain